MSKHLLMLSNEPYRPGFGSTNRQRTARAAARDGWRVRYVETVGFAPVPRRPTARDGVEDRLFRFGIPFREAGLQ